MNETQAWVLIAIIAVGVLIHIATMIALYRSAKASSTRVQSLAKQVESRALPAMEAVQALVVDSRPKLESIIDNVAVTTGTLRGQVERLDVTLNDIVDRARLQVIRADELVTRTIDRVEETTEIVQHTVVSPVRQVSGLLQGLNAAFGSFFGRRRRAGDRSGDGEMFI